MEIPVIPKNRLEKIRQLLLDGARLSPEDWNWIGERWLQRLSKKRANKFLFACIIDYQMNATVIWERCADFVENELGDPADLWALIASTRRSKWLKMTKSFGLHRFPKAHERLWYDGDAREIWRGNNASDVLSRLEDLGLGPRISRMATGALMDTGWIKGRCDVKADIHVCRVIGRVFIGKPALPEVAEEIARLLYSRNPWRLDGPLFTIGKSFCRPTGAACLDCQLHAHCKYARLRRRRRRLHS